MRHVEWNPCPGRKRVRPLWLACISTLLVVLCGIAALAVAQPAPSDAQPGDKIEFGPTLAPAAESTGVPTLAPAPESATEPAGEPASEPSADGVEVLTRGPVHEAFAETVSFNAEPGIVVPKAPPEAIEELPPDQKPEGENVAWIPGYWAWDDEHTDYLWVSGVWRVMPPGRKWISGYWRPTEGGHQWVSGYWGDAAVEQVEYLPGPPATLEVGPNVIAPSADHIWIPGTWVYRTTRYAWQPGYWIVPQPNWVWVPSYYAWTPGGFVCAGGYWDYVVARRGVLFAPVYFTGGVYARPGFYYSPATAINLTIFSNHLFCRPRYSHYYFGDFYAASYVSVGIYPWFSFTSYKGYDPIWAHHRWHHRHDHDFVRHVEKDYRHRRDHEDARPPHTWNEAKAVAGHSPAGHDKDAVAYSFHQAPRGKDGPAHMQSLDKETREKLAVGGKEVQKFRQERHKIEAETHVTASKKPVKASLPKATIASRATQKEGSEDGPPRKPGFSRPEVAADHNRDGKRGGDRAKSQNNSTPPQDLTSDDKSEPSRPGKFNKQAPEQDAPRAPEIEHSEKKGSDKASAAGRQDAPAERQRSDKASAPGLQGVPRAAGTEPSGGKRSSKFKGSPQVIPAPGNERSNLERQGNPTVPRKKQAPQTFEPRKADPKRTERPNAAGQQVVPGGVDSSQFELKRSQPSQRQFNAGQSAPRMAQQNPQPDPRSRAGQPMQRNFSRAAPPQQDKKPHKRNKDD